MRGFCRNPGNNFVGFLEDLKTLKGHFEIDWPLFIHIGKGNSKSGLWTCIYWFLSNTPFVCGPLLHKSVDQQGHM